MASFFPFVSPAVAAKPPSAAVVDHIPDAAAAVGEGADGASAAAHKIEHLYVRQAETRREENGSRLYTMYRIELHGPVRIWSVWRRYSEFVDLHAKLCALQAPGTAPPGKLPPKTYFFSTVNSPAATEERRKGLEGWLRGILTARDPRWRESRVWNEFLAMPSPPARPSAAAAHPAAARAAPKGLPAKAFTSESWLDEASELSALARQVRALLNRRDALLARGEAAQAASASTQARSSLTSFGARFAALQAGLQAFSSAEARGPALVLSEGEVTRRQDMVQRLKEERDVLTKLASDAIRASPSPTPSAARNALLSTSSSSSSSSPAAGSRTSPFQFRGTGLDSERSPAGSPSGFRRVFGAPAPQAAAAVETEETRQLDDAGLLQLQRQVMDQQDQQIESFSTLLGRQKQIGLAIGSELENQNALLGEMDADLDTTQAKLKFAQNKLKRLHK